MAPPLTVLVPPCVSIRTSRSCMRKRGTTSWLQWCESWSAGRRSERPIGRHLANAWWSVSRPTWARGSLWVGRRCWSRRSFPRLEMSCATPSMLAGTRTPPTSSASPSTGIVDSTLCRWALFVSVNCGKVKAKYLDHPRWLDAAWTTNRSILYSSTITLTTFYASINIRLTPSKKSVKM